MAAHPIVTVDQGVVRIPAELQSDPRFRDGARLELVPVHQVDVVEPELKGDWRELDGILAGVSFDATDWKRQEREFELAHDERKFSVTRADW
jgi:hypothetical protein